jgi:hypothetical protein
MRLQRLSRGSIDAPHSEALHSAEHIMRNAAVSVSLSTFVIIDAAIRVVIEGDAIASLDVPAVALP